MNTRTTVLVLLIAAALVGYLAVDIMKSPDADGGGRGARVSGRPLFDPPITAGQIMRVTIDFGDGGSMTVVRDDAESDWRQTEPFEFAVEGWRVDALADAVVALRSHDRDTTVDPASVGLVAPRATITIAGEQAGKPFSHTLELGELGAAGRAFVRFAGATAVHVVNRPLHDELSGKGPADFRGSSLARVEPGEVTRVELLVEDTAFAIERDGANWRLAAPNAGRADREAAEALINAINFASADKFVADNADDPASYGLDAPRYRLAVTIEPPGGEAVTKTLTIGLADPKKENFFAHFSGLPAVFTMSTYQVDRLRKGIDDVRDKRVTPMRAGDIRRVEVFAGKDKPVAGFTMARGVWGFGQALANPDFKLDGDAVADLVKSITEAKATGFVEGDSLARIKARPAPDAYIQMYDSAGRAGYFSFYLDHGKAVVVERDDAVGRFVDRQVYDTATAGKLAYRDKTALEVAPASIDSIKVVRTGLYGATHELKRTDGKFDLAGMDRDAVDRLVAAFNPLRVAEWVEAAVAPAPDVTVTLTTNGGNTIHLMLNTDTLIARTGGDETMGNLFRLNGPTADAISAELRDRTAIPLEIDDLASITLNDTTFLRNAQGDYALDGGGDFDEQKAAALFDTLAGLRVDRWIDLAEGAVDFADPSAQVAATSTDGSTIELSLWAADRGPFRLPFGRIGDRFFTLTPTDSAALEMGK